MHRDSISSSMAASSSWSSRSRRAASVAFCSTCGVVCGPSDGRPRHHWAAAMVEPLLRVEQVSKRFGGLLALDRASFLAQAGCISALIGPNGAGKTTLFSIIAGFAPPSAGRIVYDGADITGEPPHRLARRGIARTFQIVQPFTTLSVRENIAVGSHLSRPARADALAAAGGGARAGGLGGPLGPPAAGLAGRPAGGAEGARPKAARAGARAGYRAAAVAAGRGAGRPQPLRDPRYGA